LSAFQLVKKSLLEFSDMLASSSPTPGGGCVAALLGALAGGLLSMSCRVTEKKEKDGIPEMKTVREDADAIRAELHLLIERDARAFDEVIRAYKLPKITVEERQKRATAIQAAYKTATEIPLSVCKLCTQLLKLSNLTVESCNLNTVTDAATGGYAAYAGLVSAWLNVKLNLQHVKDAEYKRIKTEEVDAIMERGRTYYELMTRTITARLQI
jgi:formiminotetrahydrofolate cyclodeaminase